MKRTQAHRMLTVALGLLVLVLGVGPIKGAQGHPPNNSRSDMAWEAPPAFIALKDRFTLHSATDVALREWGSSNLVLSTFPDMLSLFQHKNAALRSNTVILNETSFSVGIKSSSRYAVAAQPDFKFPWDAGQAKTWNAGPHITAAICPVVDISSQSGLDFGGGGWTVLAAAGGRVVEAGSLPNKCLTHTWGVVLDHEHEDGWQTWYCHLDGNPLENPGGFQIGDWVDQGTPIGISGTAAGHLHLELRRDEARETWDGKTIDGWTVHSIEIKGNEGKAFDRHGSMTRGATQRQEREIKQCSDLIGTEQRGWVIEGEPEQTRRTLGDGNSELESSNCRILAGAGSSRNLLFVDAYNRNGGYDNLGCAENGAHWWGSGSNTVVIQDFTGSTYFGDAAITHDEPRDNPQNSVPAYVVHGAIWGEYQELGGPATIGPPTSDEFTNRNGQPQSNFKNGHITKDGDSFRFYHWPIDPPPPLSGWNVEYYNFEINDFVNDGRINFPTYVGTEPDERVSHDWGNGSPAASGVLPNHFSARWSKTLYVGPPGTFLHVKTESDDSVRVKVDGKVLRDEWEPHPRTVHTIRWHWLGSGHHTLVMEYREVTGQAVAALEYCLSLVGCAFAGEPIGTPIPTPTVQPPPPPPPPPPASCPQSDGVILYKHWHYDCGGEGEGRGYIRQNGTGVVNYVGDGFNDQASSIRIPAGWSVKLYEHSNKGGGWTCRNSDDDNDNFARYKFNNGVDLNDHVSSFEVFDSPNCGVPSNRAPNTPAPQSPDDGYVSRDGRAPRLCWNNPGDPDNDPLEFYAEVYDSPVNANSGWISDTCWRPHQLDGQYNGYQWHVKARDVPHHAESGWSTARHFSIEPPPNDPPSISFDTANGDSFPAGSINSRERSWTFLGTASDPEGQLQEVGFRCRGDNCGTQAGHTNGNNWSHTQNGMAGKNDVYFVARDDKHSTASRHLDLRIDLAAPGTTPSLNNEANPNRWPAWFRGPVQVRLKAVDNSTGRARSGVKEIHYRLDGGAWQTRAGDTVAFTVGNDGTHTAEYYAVDNVGNPEGSRSVTFKIDQTPPSPPSGINETDCHAISNQWQTCNTPRFAWAASTDATSGLAYYEFYFDTDPNGTAVHQRFNASANRLWTPKPAGVRTGAYYLRGRTRDNAGNRSAWTNLFTFRYDGTPPENPKEATHAEGIANNTWQRITNTPDFTWPTPHDEGSGIQGYHVFWGTDPNGTSSDFITNNQYLISNPLCGTNAACTGYLRLRSQDNVDNLAEDWSTAFVLRYDNAPPTVDFTFHGGITRTTQTLVTLDITASDRGSGVRAMRLSNDGKRWTPWEVPATQRLWTIPAISRQWWPVYLQVQDGVDLVSGVISHTIYLDVNPQQPRSASFRLFDHALSAGAGVYTATTGTGEVIYRGRGTVGQVIGHNVVDAAQLTSLNYLIVGGYEAGSQALPITEPGHDEFNFINGIFASGTGADTLRSPRYQMLGTMGEVGLPNNETTLSSQNHQFQPGFLAAAPPTTPTPTPEPGPTPTPEPTPACEFPQVSINDGALFTNSPEVTLSICAPRAEQMMISNDGGFGDAQWDPYTESKTWTITTYGQYVLPRFVYAAFKDTDGTVHGVYFDDIIHDPNSPSGTISVDDSVPSGTLLQAVLAGGTREGEALLSAGGMVKYVQRLGDKVLDRPMALLSTREAGAVDLYLNAQDDNSGLTEMQISASSVFSNTTWEPYSALKPWTPTGGDGVKTLYARFRDSADNVSQPAETSFVLDTLPPFGGIAIFDRIVGPNVVTAAVYLGAQDNLSGVADMRISADPGLTDAAWRPYTTTLTWPISLTAQSEGALYVQYRDLAGNASAVYSDTYQVDTTPPELYVTVAAGDTLTRTVSVYTYDELSRVETMYLSNDPLMIDGVVTLPYSETVEWAFDERREVWVQVEDSVGNLSDLFPAYAPPGCDLVGNDGVITATDVQTVAGRWREPIGLPYDRDGDNRVTVADIMWFVARWGQGCP